MPRNTNAAANANAATETYEVKAGYIDKVTKAERNQGDMVRLTAERAEEINKALSGAVVKVEEPKEPAANPEEVAKAEGAKDAKKGE